MSDPVTEECRRRRDELVTRLGGLDGLFDHLEKLQRERAATARNTAETRPVGKKVAGVRTNRAARKTRESIKPLKRSQSR